MKPSPLFSIRRLSIFCITGLFILSCGTIFVLTTKKAESDKRKKFETTLLEINKSAPLGKKNEKTGGHGKDQPGMDQPGMDQPGMAAFHEFLMTFDPATGSIPRERMLTAMNQTKVMQTQKNSSTIQWSGYGANMGGRTRMIMYDPNDPTQKKVWAGGITGGLWYNQDITSPTSAWVPVGDFWSNLSIRCMTYDPNNNQVFYIGTGEVETAMQTYRESSGLGTGIWKSADGGQTWSQLQTTTGFAYVTKIIVRSENGNSVIYAGVASGLYKESNHQSQPTDGLYRSDDGGNSWNQVLPDINGSTVPYAVSDIAVGADSRIYVGSRPNLNGEGAATLLFSDDGLNWTVNDQYLTEIQNSPSNNIPGRVVLAAAPSNSNVVYALIASGYINSANNFKYFNCHHVLRSANRGQTWTKQSIPSDITSGNNFATIAWHALDIAVDENNADRIFAGGLDMHKSVNGGISWTRISDWAKMYSGGGPDYLHADQHAIVFKPGSSSEILFGTDGGVFYTANGTGSAPAMEEHNSNYNTLQFYTCAIHPSAGTDLFYGGLQDNGTLHYTGNPLTIFDMVSGGDGAYCFYDNDNPALTITSVYYNQYYIFMNGGFLNTTSNWTSGTFISPADFDYKLNTIYCNAVDYVGNYQDHLLRLTNLTGNIVGSYLTMGTGSGVCFSAVKYSPWSPAGKATLFVGSQSGRLFKVTEAQSNSPVVTEFTGTGFPLANLSGIAVGGSEDTLMVTFSSYGVASVFKTFDGGQSWQNAEGNLPDMPIRGAIFHPQSGRHALLATETGVWESNDLGQGTTVWTPVNNGMANVRVDMLQVRTADNTVLAATHGRGLFTTIWDVVTGLAENTLISQRVFPNPTKDFVTVRASLKSDGIAELNVYDHAGNIVTSRQEQSSAGLFTCRLDLTGQPRGIYFITMKVNGRIVFTEKTVRI